MRNKGFTLLEILVTIVLFSIGVLALASLQVVNVKGAGFNKDASIATGLAQQAVEEIKKATFGALPSGVCNTTQNGMAVACTQNISGPTNYRLNDVTVTVTWGTPVKQIQLATTIAER